MVVFVLLVVMGNGHIMIKMEDCIDLDPGNNTQSFILGFLLKITRALILS